jgi:hypothetical protein
VRSFIIGLHLSSARSSRGGPTSRCHAAILLAVDAGCEVAVELGDALACQSRSIQRIPLGGLQRARAKAVVQPRVKVAQPALIAGPALIARATEPRSNLSSTAGSMISLAPSFASSDKLLARVLADPHGQQWSICSSISADGGTVRLTA